MLLLIYFIILFLLFHFRKSASPGLLLLSLYLISLTCGLLIGYDYEVNSIFEGVNLIFLAITLTIFILPWSKFNFRIDISEPNPKRLQRLTIFLFLINGVSFFVFLIACYYVFTSVSFLDYSAFKNDSNIATEFYRQIPLNHTLHLLAIYLSPTACFLIPLHFYYLIQKRYLFSILSLILSLNIVLEGISIFSRSTLVQYFMLYLLYLPFFYSKMNPRIRHMITLSGFVVFGLGGAMFVVITISRFGDYFNHGDAVFYSQSFIQNPELYSIFDYISQWYKNSGTVMAGYSFETLNGGLSFPLFFLIADKLQLINYPIDTIVLTLNTLWGNYYDKFNGLIANLLFDFGYLGTIVFVLLYSFVLQRIRPKQGVISLPKLLMLGTIFTLPATGIFNSSMKSINYNLLIIYSCFLYVYVCKINIYQKNRRVV